MGHGLLVPLLGSYSIPGIDFYHCRIFFLLFSPAAFAQIGNKLPMLALLINLTKKNYLTNGHVYYFMLRSFCIFPPGPISRWISYQYCSYLKLLVGGESEPRLLGPAPAAPPRPPPLQGGGGGVGGIDNARSRALATERLHHRVYRDREEIGGLYLPQGVGEICRLSLRTIGALVIRF